MNEKLTELMAAKGLMPLADAARTAGYDDTHLRRLVRDERIQGEQIAGRWWFVNRASLAAYIGPELAKATGLNKRLTGESRAT